MTLITAGELAEWLDPVDAGEIVTIIDACHSAARSLPGLALPALAEQGRLPSSSTGAATSRRRASDRPSLFDYTGKRSSLLVGAQAGSTSVADGQRAP